MFKDQKLKSLVLISALFLFLAGSAHALEKPTLLGEGRYFIESENKLIKRLFGARYQFENGFTSDLTRGERWALRKIFRIGIRNIPFYTITQNTIAASIEDIFNISDKEDQAAGDEVQERQEFPAEALGWGVRAVYGNDELATTSGGADVRVAILGTGIDTNHPDLSGRIAGCADFTRSSVVDNACDDKNGHGTHVAGIVAADGGFDGKGLQGVAPAVSLLIHKSCLSEGLCWADDVAKAIDYAVENDADIIVMSFSGIEQSDLVRRAIDFARDNNVLMIASAGNDGPGEDTIGFPGSHPDVVSVGAVDSKLEIPEWSSRGVVVENKEVTPTLDLVAPGVDVESTWLGDGYKTLSGTSAATSFITGLAAKLWDGVATSTRALLQGLAQDIGEPGYDNASGFGIPVLPAPVLEEEELVVAAPEGGAAQQGEPRLGREPRPDDSGREEEPIIVE